MNAPDTTTPFFTTSHQELSLHGYVSSDRFPQVIKLLTNLFTMPPDTFTEHHLIHKPHRPKNLPPNVETYYIKLLSRVEDPDADGMDGAQVYDARKQRWAIRLEDLPEVTRRPCVSRSILSANTGSGDVMGFVRAMGYTIHASYFTENRRLVHNNVVLTLSQILVPKTPEAGLGNPYRKDEELRPLDPKNGWIVQASVKVANNSDLDGLGQAVNELTQVKDMVKGVVDLEVIERLALDTRVKG
ncbi:hypothetical protein EX30DRAFT_338788 [Ascodesmis nigricans]|uniref:Mediator of RNA polymerase II transcription subunit 18 n=1 Tax=Ascodesmis nigricans TaxID=341454 RepID=A0A4S2N5B1_9PEZI|nr:hypothetical protein EX30DRAFT_338788 [Ascodesmis nigricans]